MDYKCELCYKNFDTKQGLNRHLNRKIPCNRIIQCDNCKNIFKTNQGLFRHINKKFSCKQQELTKEELITELKEENERLKLEKENEIINLDINNNIGYIYILTNLSYEIQDIFKIGKTGNLKNRLSTYNTPKFEKDKYKYIYSFKTYDMNNLEKYIHNHLKLKEYKTNNELYKIKFEDLKKIILEIKNEFDELY